jgi:diaminopimelate epimerase
MLHIRTYERGVEGETFACGTGSAAAALIAVMMGKAHSPVSVKTRGGETLTIYSKTSAPPFSEVFLEGGTCLVCRGELLEESIYPPR